jgi:hypothetical protein
MTQNVLTNDEAVTWVKTFFFSNILDTFERYETNPRDAFVLVPISTYSSILYPTWLCVKCYSYLSRGFVLFVFSLCFSFSLCFLPSVDLSRQRRSGKVSRYEQLFGIYTSEGDTPYFYFVLLVIILYLSIYYIYNLH